MTKPLNILVVEDTEDDYQLLLLEFKRSNLEVVSRRVETPAAMRQALAEQDWDLVLSDFTLPQFNAPEALKILQSTDKDIPFIIISGTIGEEAAVASLKAGANDFLIKGKFARLIPALERELREAGSRRERRQAEAKLSESERLLSEAQRIGQVGSWSMLLSDQTFKFSEEMYRLLDIERDAFEHKLENLLNLIYSVDKPDMLKWIDDVKSGGRKRELDIRLFHKHGELRHIRFTGGPVFDPDGKSIRITGNAQDITESKFAELQIQQQLKQLASLRTIDQAITSSFNLHVILNTVITQAINQLQVDAADILLINEVQHHLEYFTGQGFRTPEIETTSLPLDNKSHAGSAVVERRAIQIPNIMEKPLTRKLTGEGFHSYFSVPLIAKGQVKGALEVFHRTPLQPYPDWLNFLETLAGQAAIAIDNVSLFEELQRSNREVTAAYDATIEGWSHALDLRDRETEGHTQRVTALSVRLARMMNFSEEQLIHLQRGALLHDIGKMGVPDNILLKEGPLTDEEWMVMRQHPQLAYNWLAPIAYLHQALEIPYCHHEKWDGTGYPRGLKGKEIPIAARIFAVVDVWDALTRDRPYRSKWDNTKAITYMQEQSGKHFDPDILNLFFENLDTLLGF